MGLRHVCFRKSVEGTSTAFRSLQSVFNHQLIKPCLHLHCLLGASVRVREIRTVSQFSAAQLFVPRAQRLKVIVWHAIQSNRPEEKVAASCVCFRYTAEFGTPRDLMLMHRPFARLHIAKRSPVSKHLGRFRFSLSDFETRSLTFNVTSDQIKLGDRQHQVRKSMDPDAPGSIVCCRSRDRIMSAVACRELELSPKFLLLCEPPDGICKAFTDGAQGHGFLAHCCSTMPARSFKTEAAMVLQTGDPHTSALMAFSAWT